MRFSNRAAGLVVVVAVMYWWAVFLSMHVLEPEFNPIETPGSAYVVGRHGMWMTTTYFVLAAALLSSQLALTRNLGGVVMTKIAGLALLVAAAGAMVAGIFPMDFPPPPRTVSGRMHVVGGAMTFVPWVIGTTLFSLGMQHDRRWIRSAGTLLTISVLGAGTAAVLPLSIRLGSGGAVQRVLLTLLFAWLIVMALRLMHVRLERNE